MRTKILAIGAAVLFAMSLASNANQPVESEAPAVAPAEISTELTFNAANPNAWMKFVDPGSHMQLHQMFANPASYTQFMRPQFYMEFIKPENMMAWMNPASYQVMMDQQTVKFWMNPASYTHMMAPAMYQQTMNPANYMVYMNPNTYTALMGSQTCDPENPNNNFPLFGC